MQIRRTIPMNGGEIHDGRPAPPFANTETHWWDGSQIYGTGRTNSPRMRTFKDGKIKGRRQRPSVQERKYQGIDLTGFEENWAGVRLLHTLFSPRDNAVCDALKRACPSFDDQRLFELAVLVVSALIAKIHTVEWTPCILRHPALQIGMNANWYGALGETFPG